MTSQPQSPPAGDEQLKELFTKVRKFEITEAQQVAELRAYILAEVLKLIGEDEPEKQDGKLYSGYSNKDYDIIKVPNKSAIRRNKLRVKLRQAATARFGAESNL